MWLTELLLSILFAAMFVGLLVLLLKPSRDEHPGWTALAFLFLALFLPIWAGGMWLGPMGPAIFGMYALPFLLIGLCVALLLAAVSPPRRQGSTASAHNDPDPAYAFTPFFFAFIVIFLFVIILRYVFD